jgi:hypothetical protein
MKKIIYFLLVFPLLFLKITACQNTVVKNNTPSVSSTQNSENKENNVQVVTDNLSLVDVKNKMNGVSFVAVPDPYKTPVMQELKTINADWIAVIPYAFSRIGQPTVRYDAHQQWWGETQEGVKITIDSAHQAGVKVMLKPQVYVGGNWTGAIDFTTETDWALWEADYEKYLMPFVEIAAQKKIDALCIGTEFLISSEKREQFWRNLIKKIRLKYSGKLTYAATWNEYPHIKFWDALDFIGIDAYFPLSEKDTPSVSELCEAWKKDFEAVKNFQVKFQKPVAFTEYGYMSVDGCAGKGWEIEPKVRTLKINELAQANALDALFTTFYKEPWFIGGFIWKWFPGGHGHEGYKERDYTPQGKQAEAVLRKWHKKQ